MVNIKLDAKTSLTSDSRNWILSESGRGVSFFGTLESALQSYFEGKLRDSEAQSISSLLCRQKEIVVALNIALAPLEIKISKNVENYSKMDEVVEK